jgi:dihydroxy-acid dehydratase
VIRTITDPIRQNAGFIVLRGNMRPPAYLIKQGVTELPCLGDGQQSSTSGSPSILNASPEAAGGYAFAPSQTPWQAIQRDIVGQLETGAVLEMAVPFQRIIETHGLPRGSH